MAILVVLFFLDLWSGDRHCRIHRGVSLFEKHLSRQEAHRYNGDLALFPADSLSVFLFALKSRARATNAAARYGGVESEDG